MGCESYIKLTFALIKFCSFFPGGWGERICAELKQMLDETFSSNFYINIGSISLRGGILVQD